MLLKKVVTSLMCAITMVLICSTYSYAATNNSDMRVKLEQSLTDFEQMLPGEKTHFNLDDNDTISNNLELGEIYPNNTIDVDGDTSSNKLSKKLKKTNQYVSTIKLKDSNKPIALAYIEKEGSKWVIFRINSYNSLEDEVNSYKKDVDANPTVILDEANDVYAIGSEEDGDNIKIIEPSSQLNLKHGEMKKLFNLQSKLKELKVESTTSAAAQLTGGEGISTKSTFNYVYLVIPIAFLAYVAIFFIVSKRCSK